MKKIAIHCGNVTPNVAGVDHSDVIAGWEKIDEILDQYPLDIVADNKTIVSVDSSEVRERLRLLKPENCDSYFSQLDIEALNEDWSWNHPFSAFLYISVEDSFIGNDEEIYPYLYRIIEKIFIVLNVSLRGGCNFGKITIDRSKESRKFLSCSTLESAWHAAKVNSWPCLVSLPVIDVWDWLEKYSKVDFILANSPVEKAISVFLHFSYKDDIEATDVLQISQVLESLYLVKGEPKSRGLTRKIPVALGNFPDSKKNIVRDFYNLRSDISHGDFPLFRPGYADTDKGFEEIENHYWHISREIDKGTSIVLATIQFLIKNKAGSMSFSEVLTVEAKG